jgi:hypothetical protein
MLHGDAPSSAHAMAFLTRTELVSMENSPQAHPRKHASLRLLFRGRLAAVVLVGLSAAACSDGLPMDPVEATEAEGPRVELAPRVTLELGAAVADAQDRLLPAIGLSAPDLEAALGDFAGAIASSDGRTLAAAVVRVEAALAGVHPDARAELEVEFDAIRLMLIEARNGLEAAGAAGGRS